jgi:AcrR family transcriptional regulator
MVGSAGQTTTRAPLSRDRVLTAAVAIADAGGLPALTIRSLATELGVKPMSVYHYVADKDEILDAIVDLVFAEIELPVPGRNWRTEMQRRANSTRQVLARHPWAIPLLQSRTNPGPATLGHHNAFIGTLRVAGFPIELVAHALALIDSYLYGFAISESALPIHGPESVPDIATSMMALFDADAYPFLVEFGSEHVMRPDYDFGEEFGYGLTVILDALAVELADTARGARPQPAIRSSVTVPARRARPRTRETD